MELKILIRECKSYFIAIDDDVQVAEVEISKNENAVFEINQTIVYEEEQGRGVDYKLVKLIVEYAREHGIRLLPICAFFKGVIEREPSLQDVIFS